MTGSARVLIVVRVVSGEVETVSAQTFRDLPGGGLATDAGPHFHHPKAAITFRGHLANLIASLRRETGGR